MNDLIPFVDINRQHRDIESDLHAAFDRVLTQGSFTLGAEVDAFEKEFAAFVGTADAVGVGTGTDALHFALRANGVGKGDEVITPVNTFAATAEAILMCGARPVFVDIDEGTCLMDLEATEAAVTSRTRAIVPVHLYGQAVDMAEIGRIAASHGLAVVEDACQAHGATVDGAAAGAASDAGCFSFYPSKNLGALGDGGIVTTNDPEIAERVRLLRCHGEDSNRLHVEPGYCSRLHGLQAALLRAKLGHLDEWNQSRRESAAAYRDALADTGVDLPVELPGREHVYHLFVVQTDDREEFRRILSEHQVQTAVHYPIPLHLEPAFSDLGYAKGAFPVAERVTDRIVSLPMFPHLTDTEIERVAEAVTLATEQ